jgi:amidase
MDGDPATGRPAVDAVIYPNNTSDFHDNDSAGLGGAFATAPASNSGAPEVIVPIGPNDHGHPVSLQIQGRAWDDARLVGFAYAIEQRLKGHVEPTAFPALPFDADAQPQPIVIQPEPKPQTTAPAPAAPTNLDPGTVSPPAPAAKPAPLRTVRVAARTVRQDGQGRFTVRVTCAKGVSSCRVRVVVSRGSARMAVRTLTIRAGRTFAMRVRPNAAMRRSLLRGRTVTVRVALAGTGVKGTSTTLKVRPRTTTTRTR